MRWQPVSYWRSWHRMHSVRWSGLAVVCAAALKGYNYEIGVSPSIVSGIPHWVPTLLLWGTIVGPLLAAAGALIKQPNLPPPKPPISVPQPLNSRQPPC